jgi:hypothetical protein
MASINKDSFGHLGLDYQLRLLAQILTDKKFANSILDIIDPNYFEEPYLRVITSRIKDAKDKDDVIPDMKSLEFRLLEDVSDDIQRQYVVSQLRKIQSAELNDTLWVQEKAMSFCKHREMKKAWEKIGKIINNGDCYYEIDELWRKAIDHGDNKDDGINVFDGIQAVLADDFRKPIPTGINGLDEIMDGGLARTELGVILAPFGVGKTTMMTKLASSAVGAGYNALQIYFEDSTKVIQRKHLSCWSGYDLNSLGLHRDEIMNMSETMKTEEGRGELRLKKFSSDGTTIPVIKQYIRKLIASGFRPDIILLDYIDCVESSKKIDDPNIAEGSVMRQFEALLSDMDMAGWTAIQGNRSSIKAEIVEADQMGGSIKKAQIAHFVLSIAKTLDQKEADTATMAVLKSRFGKSGVVFNDIRFDNARIQIDMGNSQGARTRTELKSDKDIDEKRRLSEMFAADDQRKKVIGLATPNNDNNQ